MPFPLYGSGGLTLRISAAVWPTACLSIPLTTTSVGVGTSTLTLVGISMGFLPIRLIALPDETDHFAADAFALGGAARDEPLRRGHDRGPHAAEDARKTILPSVHTASRLGDPLEVGEDP